VVIRRDEESVQGGKKKKKRIKGTKGGVFVKTDMRGRGNRCRVKQQKEPR
jgi:hypothetical protein